MLLVHKHRYSAGRTWIPERQLWFRSTKVKCFASNRCGTKTSVSVSPLKTLQSAPRKSVVLSADEVRTSSLVRSEEKSVLLRLFFTLKLQSCSKPHV